MSRLVCSMLTAAAVALSALGCGSDDGIPREPVSGTVTLDGQPVAQGQITFMPETGENVAAAPIEGGRYSIRRAEGPSPGAHRVAVWSQVPTGRKIASDPLNPSELEDEYREAIPERYNAKTELTADVQQGGSNEFDFELSSEAAAP